MLEVYLSFIWRIYRVRPSVLVKNKLYIVRLSSKYVVLDLLKLCKFGIYDWTLPEELFKIDNAKEFWLKSFFSAEGYVNPKYIKIQSVNIKSLKKVSSILNEIGVENRVYNYLPKNKNHSEVLQLFICSKDSKRLFYEKIGFWHSCKTTVLKEALGL